MVLGMNYIFLFSSALETEDSPFHFVLPFTLVMLYFLEGQMGTRETSVNKIFCDISQLGNLVNKTCPENHLELAGDSIIAGRIVFPSQFRVHTPGTYTSPFSYFSSQISDEQLANTQSGSVHLCQSVDVLWRKANLQNLFIQIFFFYR